MMLSADQRLHVVEIPVSDCECGLTGTEGRRQKRGGVEL